MKHEIEKYPGELLYLRDVYCAAVTLAQVIINIPDSIKGDVAAKAKKKGQYAGFIEASRADDAQVELNKTMRKLVDSTDG